ncbi:PIN domain-containing protein [Streptomyces umbrinus]|uniref:PIN domain-containing protein n=1 Tax=Streptomyces umbrinus TaxID=67370 RepID=UPI001675F4D5|nr:PIN domain-containing protein [Streptomyces umbrinus]
MSIGEASRRLAEVIADLQILGRSPMCVEYLAWADTCENRLRAVFAEPDIVALLHTRRYWHLYRHHEAEADDVWINTNLPVPDPAGQEATAQLAALTALARQAEQLGALAEWPGRVLVYDTNSLMHYQPPDAIDWAARVKAQAVRLVVPLVVIDELDRKQHEGSDKMAQRARSALRALDKFLDGARPGRVAPLPGRAGVTIEILMDEPGHRREASADDEVIERGVLLAQITCAPVTVVTADTGMRLRATAAGLETLRLPAESGKDQPAG